MYISNLPVCCEARDNSNVLGQSKQCPRSEREKRERNSAELYSAFLSDQSPWKEKKREKH